MSAARLRPAASGDHRLYARFFAELGMSEGPLDRKRWSAECAPTSVFLERGRSAIGYAFWNGDGSDVHVRHVVVDRAVRGQGHGRVLMLELAKLLLARGARNWRLNVLTSNTAAIGLYSGLGFEKVYETVVLRLETRNVPRLPESLARAREAGADSDALHEQRFDLLDGHLARARGYKGVRVLEARLADGA
ncbi:MAG: GNAT family N-acetyltransferase, partial [Planctomycetota bacterium]